MSAERLIMDSTILSQGVEVRSAETEEMEEVLDLLDSTMYHPYEIFASRFRNYPFAASEQSIIVKVEDKIVSHVRIYPAQLYYQTRILNVGMIGDCCTNPDYRKMGYGAICLNYAAQWLYNHGYHISLIYSGILNFYKSAGWVDVPSSRYAVSVSDISKLLPNRSELRVRRFEREKDIAAVSKVYNLYNQGRNLSAVRSELYWRNSFYWQTGQDEEAFYVVESNKGIIGYSRMSKNMVNEFCSLSESASIALWQAIVKWTRKWQCWPSRQQDKSIVLCLAHDEPLIRFLTQYDSFRIQESVCSILVRPISMLLLFESLKSIWADAAIPDFDFTVKCEKEVILIKKSGLSVQVCNSVAINPDIELDYCNFCRGFMGMPVENIGTGMPMALNMIKQIFPKSPFTIWPLDLS